MTFHRPTPRPPILQQPLPDMEALRYFPMKGDSMEPGLRSGDVVMALPVDHVTGDAVYVLEILGQPTPQRVCHTGDGDYWVSCDNPLYTGAKYTREQLNAAVIGIVVGVFAWWNTGGWYGATIGIDQRRP